MSEQRRLQAENAEKELAVCNEKTARYGLALSEADIRELVACRAQSLRDSSAKGRARLLSAAAGHVCSELHCGGADTVAYLKTMCGNLLPRLESALAAGDLSNIFVAFLPENVITSWDQ